MLNHEAAEHKRCLSNNNGTNTITKSSEGKTVNNRCVFYFPAILMLKISVAAKTQITR